MKRLIALAAIAVLLSISACKKAETTDEEIATQNASETVTEAATAVEAAVEAPVEAKAE